MPPSTISQSIRDVSSFPSANNALDTAVTCSWHCLSSRAWLCKQESMLTRIRVVECEVAYVYLL